MKTLLKRLRKDAHGTSAIEYGLICAAIVIGVVAAVDGLADENTGMWARISSKTAAAHNSVN
ncbi:MAG TPA: Flp family type IVb pilin [Novosphingobium sp.]|nr:Flp family type IVb pilin [Novosphingobium sp.]